MIPPIAGAHSEFSVPIPFDEANPEAMMTLDLLKEMYIGKEHPFLTSSRDGFTWLIIPKTITKVFDANSFTVEAPSALRIPDREGASNGLPTERGI